MKKRSVYLINFLFILYALSILCVAGVKFFKEGFSFVGIVMMLGAFFILYVVENIFQSTRFRSYLISMTLNESERKTLGTLFWDTQEKQNKNLSEVEDMLRNILKLGSSTPIVTSALIPMTYRGNVTWSFNAIVHDNFKKKNGLLVVIVKEGWKSIFYKIIYKDDPEITFECRPYLKGGAPFLHLKAKSGGRQVLSTRQNIADQLDSIL